MRKAATLSFLFAAAILSVLYVFETGRAREIVEHARAAGEVFRVKYDLLVLARAEHSQFLHHGSYVPLEHLQEEADADIAGRSPYAYEAALSEHGFHITAVHRGLPGSGWPRRISIDERFDFRTDE